MKKLVSILYLFLLCLLVFTSCSDDDDDRKKEENKGVQIDVDTWKEIYKVNPDGLVKACYSTYYSEYSNEVIVSYSLPFSYKSETVAKFTPTEFLLNSYTGKITGYAKARAFCKEFANLYLKKKMGFTNGYKALDENYQDMEYYKYAIYGFVPYDVRIDYNWGNDNYKRIYMIQIWLSDIYAIQVSGQLDINLELKPKHLTLFENKKKIEEFPITEYTYK